jgi:nucleotide-binding universal stress UspA family protein
MPEIIRPVAARILLPVLDGADIAAVLPIAADLAGSDGEVVLLALVPPPREGDLARATQAARAARRRLRSMARALMGVAHDEHVRTAQSPLEGIRQAVGEGADLLLLALPPAHDAWRAEPFASLLRLPPCDIALVKPSRSAGPLRSALVSARGGPHAELALDVAERLSRSEGARLTVLHVDVPGAGPEHRRHEQRLFQSLIARSADAPRVRTSSIPADSARGAILAETGRHDVLVVGARVTHGENSEIGEVPAALLENSPAAVLVVKTGRSVNPAIFRPNFAPADTVVSAWFVENTLHCRDYADLDDLIARKERMGLTVGVALIAGFGVDSIAAHARALGEDAPLNALIDGLILFAGEDPEAAEAAERAGLRFCAVPGGSAENRGLLIRGSIERLHSDIVVWIDADIRNPHAKLIYGLAGPLLTDERLQLVKAFYRRPSDAPEGGLESLAGEFGARPLLNLFFPELSGVIAPLATEQAMRRASALALPPFPGAAAPLGLLIDAYAKYGLHAIAQTALEERIARPLDLAGASRLSFSAAQVVALRAEALHDASGGERLPGRFHVISQRGDRFDIDGLDVREVDEVRAGSETQ